MRRWWSGGLMRRQRRWGEVRVGCGRLLLRRLRLLLWCCRRCLLLLLLV